MTTDDFTTAASDETRNAIAASLARQAHTSELLICSRVWEAWQVGTMTDEDFALVSDDPDVIADLTEAVVSALAAQEPSDAETSAAARAINTEGWTCDGGTHEPGNYDDCVGCQHVALDIARAALSAARRAREEER